MSLTALKGFYKSLPLLSPVSIVLRQECIVQNALVSILVPIVTRNTRRLIKVTDFWAKECAFYSDSLRLCLTSYGLKFHGDGGKCCDGFTYLCQ